MEHQTPSFNGATLLQAWRARKVKWNCKTTLSFNGATLLQAWRVSHCIYHFVYNFRASMGPRFFKRGECWKSPRWPRQCPSFNGATLLQAWRDRTPATLRLTQQSFNGATLLQAWRDEGRRCAFGFYPASMGPRFFKRGEAFVLSVPVRI